MYYVRLVLTVGLFVASPLSFVVGLFIALYQAPFAVIAWVLSGLFGILFLFLVLRNAPESN